MSKDSELEQLRLGKALLEKQLSKAKKELERYRNEAEKLSVKYSALSNDFNEMSQKFNTSQRLRVTAETEVSGLRKEIDELSSALFSEANDMVSSARRSENDFKQKNRQLQNEIEEKDLMIETYKQQLTQLKEILENLEDKSKDKKESKNLSAGDSHDTEVSSAASTKAALEGNKDSVLQDILYAPPIQSLRYDLELFNLFLIFAKPGSSLTVEESTSDYSDIKETKFYKRILHDDIQPTLRLDTAPGVSFLQKRSLMSAIVNGRVIIEPIASVNESFKRNSGILNANANNSKPIATPDPCSICGEARNDALEHARLYMLKIYSAKSQKNKGKPNMSRNSSSVNVNDLGGSTGSPAPSNTASEFTYTFPLCAYCVFRIRSTCELYAFLRSIKAGGVWKFNNEVNEKKAWIECTRIRLKMFWSRQGIWDGDAKILDNKVFNATQILGDSVSVGTPKNTAFQFQEKRPSLENQRNSYAGTIGSYVERFTNSNFSPVSTPRRDAVLDSPKIDSTVLTEHANEDGYLLPVPLSDDDHAPIESEFKDAETTIVDKTEEAARASNDKVIDTTKTDVPDTVIDNAEETKDTIPPAA